MHNKASSADSACASAPFAAGRLWVVAAALLWSSSGVFAKAPVFSDWPREVRGPMLAFWRALFAAVVLLPAVRRPRWRGGLVPLVFCFAAMNVVYLSAMTLTTAANAIWLQSTCPWWVFVMTVLVLRRPVARRDLVPLACGMLGVGTIVAFESFGQAPTGVLLGLASGIAYGGVVICLWQLSGEDSAWLVALCQVVSALVLLPWICGLGRGPSSGQLLVLAGFGVFQMALPYLFLIRALRSIGGQEAAAIGLIEPTVMPVWVYLAWGEKPAWWTIAGAGMILLGLVMRYAFLASDAPVSRRLPGP
jgi:drug/metabolite transporter (DMT)-like permease